MTQILLLGKDGQVGWELTRTLDPLGDVTALGRQELDLQGVEGLRRTVQRTRPEIIVNAAAYNNVDGAESETELAHKVNAEAPGALAEEAQRLDAVLVHYSTDYVFDGHKREPYTEDDQPGPINEYGRSKLAGERAVREAEGKSFILRTSWVYSTRRPCFVTKVLRWAREQEVLRIVEDQRGSPTWCRTLGEATALMLAIANERGRGWIQQHSGVYHLVSPGSPSRFELAEAVLELKPLATEQPGTKVKPASSEEFPTAAGRPTYSALDPGHFEATFGMRLPSWRDALALALERSGNTG